MPFSLEKWKITVKSICNDIFLIYTDVQSKNFSLLIEIVSIGKNVELAEVSIFSKSAKNIISISCFT